jgi:hypothetical protein
VAVELLLLSGGPAATRLSLVVPRPRTRRRDQIGLAVRCPACDCVSVNLVSHEHVDLPFHNDEAIGVVEHVFAEGVLQTLEAFRSELYSATFDARRLLLQ